MLSYSIVRLINEELASMRSFYLITVLFISNFANAYPISPNALKKLVSDSQVIVVAQVESIDVGRNEVIEEGDSIEFINELSQAHLVVLDVLKGNPESEITVEFDKFVICPAPAYYEEGSKVLAFLDKKPLDNTYSTHARSYGSKKLNDKELDIYLQRIEEMQQILLITDKDEQRKETIQWLVKCVENKATRFEGLYDLNPQSEIMSYFDRNKDTFTNKFKLTDNQQKRLRTVLFSLDKLDYGDFGLIDIVKESNDDELIQFLISQFKKYDFSQLTLEQLYTIQHYMQYLSQLTVNTQLMDIKEEFSKKHIYADNEIEAAKGLIQEFLSVLDDI